MEDVQVCDVFEILVTGKNDIGVSNRAAVNGSLPLLPEINTLQYLLYKSNISGVTLTVTFMVSFFVC